MFLIHSTGVGLPSHLKWTCLLV